MSAGTSTAPTRSGRTWLVVLALVVTVVIVAGTLLGGGGFQTPVDPESTERDGGQAVARVLEQEGVAVEVVRSEEEYLRTDTDGATVVLTNTGSLGETTARTAVDHAGGAVALVGIGSADSVVAAFYGQDALDLDAVVPRSAAEVAASCDLAPVAGLVAAVDDGLDLASPEDLVEQAGPVEACFGSPGALVRSEPPGGPVTWLLTAPEVVANASVTDADNAAVALRLLGQGDRVVWYVADVADIPVEESVSIGRFVPPWLGPALALLTVAGLAALLWRGRRLGPLAVEPLPVVVRAAEATHARGRVYHRTRDRAHAAAVLGEATRGRLAHRLRLPGDAPAAVVAEATARRTGGDPQDILSLLIPTPPTRDAGLADLGRRLRALEDEVHP